MGFPGILTSGSDTAGAIPTLGFVRGSIGFAPYSAQQGTTEAQSERSSSPLLVESQRTTPALVIMLAEDNPADVALVNEAIQLHQLAAVLHVFNDGEKAFEFIRRAEDDDSAPCPTLALLDLNLPKKNGVEILERLRQSPKCQGIPVIIITSSDSPKDRASTIRLGANRYFRKPSDYDEFLELGQLIKDVMDERNSSSGQ